MSAKVLKIDSVLLDLENPRIRRSSSQREALQNIISDQGNKLAVLAESIVENGLNPMDRLLVIRSVESKSKFTVIEGNRRLAALKILNNPSVLDDLSLRPGLLRRLKAAASRYDASIESLPCYELADRAEGGMWISQRHSGENGGRGIVNWGGVASARFKGSSPALQAFDFVLAHGELTEDDRVEIDDGFPITTLGRLLATTEVRKALGLEIRQNKLESKLPPEELIRPLRRIVRDLAKGTVSVTDLKAKKLQVEWIGKLGTDLPDLKKATALLKPVDAIDESDFAPPPPPAAPRPRPAPKAIPQKNLVPKSCILNVTNPKIKEIFEELRVKLQLVDHPHAISVMFRVFLEQSVDAYLERVGVPLVINVPHHGEKLKALRSKISNALDHMIKGGTPVKDLDGIAKGIDDKNSPLNLDTLNNYVHNRFYSPQERDLIVSWNNSQLFFEKIWP